MKLDARPLCGYLLGLLLVCCALPGFAEEDPPEPLQTDWLKLVKGYRGETVGVELREIEEEAAGGTQRLILAVPKTAIDHPDEIEEVVVVARMPEKTEILPDASFEWLDSLDGDNYGLLIRLSADSQWPIRLYMRSDEGFIPRTITTLE